jgi:hypothetical protein
MSKLNEFKMLSSLRCSLLVMLAVAVSSSSLAGAQSRLMPAPREAHFAGETATLGRIVVETPGNDAEDQFAARELEEAARQALHAATGAAEYRVVLLRADAAEGKAVLARAGIGFDAAMEAEGYVLSVEPQQSYIVAASSAGIFYGVQTLKQLLPIAGEKAVLPTGTVRDWPAMKYRGIDDDLSRGPFPALEFQKHQIRVFAAYKINLYSPYFEHTLLYPNHSIAAPPGSSMSPEDVKELVRYARQYHITVLPEQEAFGHLHHVLKYDLYKDVAETPHGYVLAPGQKGTLPLIKDWYDVIAKEFPSPLILIGADETDDLGAGRTAEAVKAKGYGPVYVDFLKQIHEELAPLNKRLLFWGDIGDANPAAVPGLPKDMIAVPWNYWDTKGFDKMIEPFQKAGMETWVAPGDANWSEVYPVAKTAFGNIQGFIRDGQRLGSTGALTTVWNDDGEGLFNENWYGVMFGAVAAWQPGESAIAPWQEAYGPLFHGDLSGKVNEAEKEIMAAHAALATAKTEMKTDDVFWIDPWTPLGQEVSAKVLPVATEVREHAERAIELLAEARLANPGLKEADALTAMDLGARRLDLIGMKFELAQEIVGGYAQVVEHQHDKDKAVHSRMASILEEISSDNGRCEDLRDAYSAIRAEYVQVWLSENRPYWLNNVTVRYDLRIEDWQRRAERFQEAFEPFYRGGEMPSAESLGMPATKTVAGTKGARK